MTYKVIKEVWTPDLLDCEHPLCSSIHKPWHKRQGNSWFCNKPIGERTEWFIVDAETNEPVQNWFVENPYNLKRDAVSALKQWLEILARESQTSNA